MEHGAWNTQSIANCLTSHRSSDDALSEMVEARIEPLATIQEQTIFTTHGSRTFIWDKRTFVYTSTVYKCDSGEFLFTYAALIVKAKQLKRLPGFLAVNV